MARVQAMLRARGWGERLGSFWLSINHGPFMFSSIHSFIQQKAIQQKDIEDYILC